jgi:hypothetical protein
VCRQDLEALQPHLGYEGPQHDIERKALATVAVTRTRASREEGATGTRFQATLEPSGREEGPWKHVGTG